MLSKIVAAIAVLANSINILGVLVSIITDVRVWPPGDRDWRYWLTWGNWYPATAGFVVVGVLDWGSLHVVPWAGRFAGAVAVIVGLGIAVAAILDLGVSETEGLEGSLQTDGLYRYSRNPQYVGDILSAVGWVVLTDSSLALLIGATYVLYYLLLPFAEEPWLNQEYGPAYERYCREVPRFVGMQTARNALK